MQSLGVMSGVMLVVKVMEGREKETLNLQKQEPSGSRGAQAVLYIHPEQWCWNKNIVMTFLLSI